MLKQNKKDWQGPKSTRQRQLLQIQGARAMLAEIARQHHGCRKLLRTLTVELAYSGDSDPGALAVNPQPDPRNKNYQQQQQTEDVKGGSDIYQLAVVVEGDEKHGHHGNAQPDELFHPVVSVGCALRIWTVTKTDDANSH